MVLYYLLMVTVTIYSLMLSQMAENNTLTLPKFRKASALKAAKGGQGGAAKHFLGFPAVTDVSTKAESNAS